MAHTCDFCGRGDANDTLPMTWSFAVERGRTVVYCDQCTREHARSIESRLDSTWW